jgi:hypothetical protein
MHRGSRCAAGGGFSLRDLRASRGKMRVTDWSALPLRAGSDNSGNHDACQVVHNNVNKIDNFADNFTG